MHQYLAKHEDKSDAAAGFEEVVRLVQAKDATDIGKSDETFPEYVGYEAELKLLPMGLAAAAAQGQPTIAELGSEVLVHEWTIYPGYKLFVKFCEKLGSKFKEVVCGKDGFYEQLNKGLLGQDKLPAAIAGQILTIGFATTTF